jgi:hypothetical protein
MTTIRLLLLFVAGLGTAAVDVRDIDGVSRHVLSPAANQLDLLFFISADCPISNRYAPEIQRVCNDYRSRGVRCFTVYPEALETSAVKRHRQDYRFDPSIPAVIDRDHRLVRAVGPRVTPEAALYSSSGRLYRGRIDDLYVDVGRSRSAPTRRDLRMAIDAAIAGKPIEAAETEAVGCFIQTP